jgi:hypothetical protein
MLPIITTGSGFSTCFPYFLTPKVLILSKKARHFAAPDLTVRMKTDLGKKRKSIFWPMCTGRTPHRERKIPALV